ncbi:MULTISPECIES: hypothetical protein [Micromonospora]|uniref:Uncharacterized protein n=1 Tax=Micromonospora solifontis TaxID=2487138 RepID=A0ABX9W984_9ACTN|nr:MULTISPECIES: hypothetical protein [Micromonospora]NES17095.1 hypothetical protein [Micromonospora sp. PPF5-17B]NES39395.1 hypothetical protein [Micromonospora solifontis]NES57101.1 hypothetical protein [Micromonospora sp. PPF5-6]RNL89122.1 hypothetical protein EFE23_25230 [Micromonospora solifontis]
MTTSTVSPPGPATRTRLGPAAPLAAAWLGGWGVLALVATLTGHGYPFGANDPRGDNAAGLLQLVPVSVGPPLFAAVLLTGALVALAMAGTDVRPSRPVRVLLTGAAATVAFLLAVVVPGMGVLALLGYAPMLIIGAPFGWPPVDYAEVFTWPLFARLAALAGGMLLAGALLAWRRRTAGPGRGWTAPAAAARWGRWAAWTAAAIPVLYALTRFAWLAGIPLGMSRETLAEMRADGAVWAGAGLGAFAVVGAVLTLGLVARWGERFPRWLPGLAGRPVPVPLAVVPAGLVALAVMAASLDLLAAPEFLDLIREGNSAALPMVLWPVWAVALAAAAYAYRLRRRT